MLIDKTGKVGQYYETQYWFKQAYLRWDYQSIPAYQELHINKYTRIESNYGLSTIIANEVCDHLVVSIYQYYTQESYRAKQIYVQLTFHSDAIEYIKDFITDHYTINIDQSVHNQLVVTFTRPETDKLHPADKAIVRHKFATMTSYKNCPVTYRPDDYGHLVYNLHDDIVSPTTTISCCSGQSNYYTLDHYSSLKALGTVKTDIYIYFISIGVRSEETGSEHTGSDHTALVNSVNFTHAYNAPLVTVGLKTEEYINSFQNFMVNFAIATLSFVKVTDIQP